MILPGDLASSSAAAAAAVVALLLVEVSFRGTLKYIKWAWWRLTATMKRAIMTKTRMAAFNLATVFEWSRVKSVNLGWTNSRAASRYNNNNNK